MTDEAPTITEDEVQESELDSLRAVEKVADRAEVSAAPAGDAVTANAIVRLAEQQAATNSLIAENNELMRQNLNEFSRALANTDVSAQRAAAAAEQVEEAIEPADESSPKQGEQPENIKELPTKDVQEAKSRSWWFGKAANRHGRGQ